VWLLPLLSASAALGCEASFDEVMGLAESAIVAWEENRSATFMDAYEELDATLPCLTGLLEPAEIKTLYLVDFLNHWWRREQQGAFQAWTSLRGLDPDFDLSVEVALVDPKLITWADSHHPPEGAEPTVALPVVPWSLWRVEGQDAARDVPVGRPVVVQLMDSRDGHLQTWLLPEGGLPSGFESPDSIGTRSWLDRAEERVQAVKPTTTLRETTAEDVETEREITALDQAVEVQSTAGRELPEGVPLAAVGAACLVLGGATAGISYGTATARLNSGGQPWTSNQQAWFVLINTSGWGLALSGAVVAGVGGVRLLEGGRGRVRLQPVLTPTGAGLVGAW